MGRTKAGLDFGGEPLLLRVLARILPAVRCAVVVAAPGQDLPALPEGVRLARDPVEGRGPLQGIAVGLAALAPEVGYAFGCATDAPFVSSALVRRLHALALAGDADGPFDAVVPEADGELHATLALYATRLGARAAALLAGGERRARALALGPRVRRVSPSELLLDPALRAEDPELACLLDLDTPEAYRAALERWRG
ncbi:MAG: NTP transferase domain-containing protein [Myxococcales bacterium]|nr:NTP transferase domain-containing protein [Myxococcales bacterium]